MFKPSGELAEQGREREKLLNNKEREKLLDNRGRIGAQISSAIPG